MCCGIDHWKDYAPTYQQSATIVYRVVNERIVGKIPLKELQRNHYYESEAQERDGTDNKKDYTVPVHRTQTRETMSTQQETLLSLIERAREQQKIPWQ